MLFKADILKAVAEGHVDLAFRAWRKPLVKAGTRIRTAAGLVTVKSVRPVERGAISAREAKRAGHDSLPSLLAALAEHGKEDCRIYRIAIALSGPDPRVALRNAGTLTRSEATILAQKLARMDAASRNGPWTDDVLGLIAQNGGIRAADLAARRSEDTLFFKSRVRRLKELGLTESLDVGYRLSPRGVAYRKLKG